jgi:glycosyltransferase involved in cell wall biosynthesis
MVLVGIVRIRAGPPDTIRVPTPEERAPMGAPSLVEDATSASWDGDVPEITVVVSTFRRPDYLAGLFEALERQSIDPSRYEVVVVDNGSGDDTWDRLAPLVTTAGLRARALRLAENRGPGGGRNAGFAHSRAPVVAITDDDCLPSPTWLEHVLAGFAAGADVVQGVVAPDPREAERGWWDHTVDISGPSPWFETSNVAYRRTAIDGVGGFDERDPLTAQHGGGRAFGEDAVLGARVVAAGGQRGWAGDAVVHHRIVRSTYRHQLREWRNLRGFPGLVRRSPVGEESLYLSVFLNRQTAQFDLALAGAVAALLTRRPGLLVAALPWAWNRWSSTRSRTDSRLEAAMRVAQRGLIEAVGFVSLVEGSIRHRKLVL